MARPGSVPNQPPANAAAPDAPGGGGGETPMYQYQLVLKDSGGATASSYPFNTYESMEFWSQQLVVAGQPAGGSAEYQRRPGTWDGSAWSYGAWASCP